MKIIVLHLLSLRFLWDLQMELSLHQANKSGVSRDLEVINTSVIVKVVDGKDIVQEKYTMWKKKGCGNPTSDLLKRKNKELTKEIKNHQFSRPSPPRTDEYPAWTETWESSEEKTQSERQEQRTPGMESLALSLPLTEKLG